MWSSIRCIKTYQHASESWKTSIAKQKTISKLENQVKSHDEQESARSEANTALSVALHDLELLRSTLKLRTMNCAPEMRRKTSCFPKLK